MRKYKCRKCGKILSWKEFTESVDTWPNVACCSDCLPKVAQKAKDNRLKQLRENITDILIAKGVPLRYLHCTLDNFQPIGKRKILLDKVRGYLDRQLEKTGKLAKEGLFLIGPNGTGKTHLAVAVMRELILKGIESCRFIKVPKLLFEIRKTFRDGYRNTEGEFVEKFENYTYLVLDELGVEKVTDWSLQDLYLVIDGRSNNLRPTIITSNLSLDEIEKHLDSRFSSRIVEMCRVIKIECEDWRLLARRQKLESAK